MPHHLSVCSTPQSTQSQEQTNCLPVHSTRELDVAARCPVLAFVINNGPAHLHALPTVAAAISEVHAATLLIFLAGTWRTRSNGVRTAVPARRATPPARS